MKSRFVKTSFSILSLFVFAFTFTFGAFTQDLDDVTISGEISDLNGDVIIGATVTVTSVSTGIRRIAFTKKDGRYKIIELAPDVYKIIVSASGFSEKKTKNFETIAAQNLRLNFSLSPSSVTAEQTITISDDDLPIVGTMSAIVGGTVTKREIEEIPNTSNNVLDLIYTLAGVAEEPLSIRNLADDRRGNGSLAQPNALIEGGIFSLSGGAAFSNNITIDGLDNNDDRSARERFQPPVDSVAEVQVITNQFSAEYGRASGGRVNIRTRAGEGKFRGRFSMFFKDDNFNANSYNNNRRGIPRLPFTEYNPGTTLGGPLPFWYFKNKTFFFTSYTYRNRSANTLIDTVLPINQNPRFTTPRPTHLSAQRIEENPDKQNPNPALIAPYVKTVGTPRKRHRFTQRIDHNFTDTHNITFNYQLERSKNFSQYRESTRFLEETLQGRMRSSNSFYIADNYVFNSNLVNQFRFQFSNYRPGFASAGSQSPVILLRVRDETVNIDRVNTTVVLANSTSNFANRREETRYQFQETLNYVVGNHNLKFGADVQRIRSRANKLRDTTGTFNFDRVAEFLNNQVVRYRRKFGNISTQKNTYSGLFTQYIWSFRPNISLNFGVRYERETIINDNNNWSPRISLAYSPGEQGKTVIRIGGGVFYNRALLRTIDDFTFSIQGMSFDSRRLNGPRRDSNCVEPSVADAMKDRCVFLNFVSKKFPNAPTIEEIRGLQGVIDVEKGFKTEANFTRRLVTNIKIPESYQFNVAFERDLGKAFAFKSNFIFNKSAHLWRETNINAYVLPNGFKTYTDYLLSLRSVSLGRRSYSFELAGSNSADERTGKNGVKIINLNSLNNSRAFGRPLRVARDVIAATLNRALDNDRGQVEEVGSIGKSVYEGLTLELRRRFRPLAFGFRFSMRLVYELSRTRDDGMVNTSSAQIPGNFSAEFGASTQDRRHKFRFSGTTEMPKWLGKLRVSTLLRIESAKPFNVSIGGRDRSLDDVNNDRPNFKGNLNEIVYRNPGSVFPQALVNSFSLAPIGTPGNLPRNAGCGPALFIFNVNLMRQFKISERFRIRPQIEFDNIFNARIFSFGSDFINFANVKKQAFRDNFLVPSRTFSPRQIRIGIRIEF